jgi:hypothetical protein
LLLHVNVFVRDRAVRAANLEFERVDEVFPDVSLAADAECPEAEFIVAIGIEEFRSLRIIVVRDAVQPGRSDRTA